MYVGIPLSQGDGSHHALELPHVHDHAEGVPSAGSRLPGAFSARSTRPLCVSHRTDEYVNTGQPPLSSQPCTDLYLSDHHCEAAVPTCLSFKHAISQELPRAMMIMLTDGRSMICTLPRIWLLGQPVGAA